MDILFFHGYLYLLLFVNYDQNNCYDYCFIKTL